MTLKGIKELQNEIWMIKNLKANFGELRLNRNWDEPMGPTSKPNVTDLRAWDFKLLSRFEPFYAPFCDMCCMCTFGKCDLLGKKGACGINADAQQARTFLLSCCIGTAAHTAHAHHLLKHLIEKKGENFPIDLGMNIDIEAPIMRTVIGEKPGKLGDFRKVLDYCEEQLTYLLSATHTGQEGNILDFESKTFHAGMIDELSKEVCDISQIAAYGMPKGEEDVPLIELGLGVVDKEKPVILCIGHNVAPGAEIVDYTNDKGLYNEVEVCGICCSAIDISRRDKNAKIIGPLSKQLEFIRSGIADVIVVDEQCIRTDVLEEALKNNSTVIVTTDNACYGLPDRTNEDADKTVSDLIERRIDGALILDAEKVGEIAVKTALRISKDRRNIKILPDLKEVTKYAEDCIKCRMCERTCPNSFPVFDAIQDAGEGQFSKLLEVYEICYSCGKCEESCKADLPLVSMLTKVGGHYLKNQNYRIRQGRGPIQDVEIRKVGRPIVFGEIPGIIAFVGCTNYPKGGEEIAKMAEEFLKRNYIVVATGCSAMSIGEYKDKEGITLYEKYEDVFGAGGLVNLGSCVSNAHVSGACIKIANIFAKKPLRANYEEIADYILNRIGACGVAFGAYSQKASAITAGINRWGIPAIVGPHGTKFKRLLLGRKDKKESWKVNDLRSGEVVEGEPSPEHLLYAAETKEEVIALIPKICIRVNDTPKGRQTKLTNYIDLHQKYIETFPNDLHLFVRNRNDIPITYRKQVTEFLESKGWKPKEAPFEPSLMDFKKEEGR
ncbi:MAG: CO dehydrogenase/acetyl-CoA synthase complex subunit epsilon [Euryarchaeota archaeon]|nr:CO dehydrogenase/acetyl-CoA synthase complex subunit epsilon [Euryarchaeota archaeon]